MEQSPERGIGGKLVAKLRGERRKRVGRQRNREKQEEHCGLTRFHGDSRVLEREKPWKPHFLRG